MSGCYFDVPLPDDARRRAFFSGDIFEFEPDVAAAAAVAE
jgi:hypothetical protein